MYTAGFKDYMQEKYNIGKKFGFSMFCSFAFKEG